MNNRDKLQEQFKQSINDGYRYSETGLEEAASNCTTVCMEAMGEFAEWLYVHYYYAGNGLFATCNPDKRFTLAELLTLYRNLK